MLEKTLLLNTIDDVKEFVEITSSKNYNITLQSGRFIVDAKSILGVFSLDLTKPVLMKADCTMVAELSKQIAKFICK